MKKIVIETRTSLKKVNDAIKKVYGDEFSAKFKRGSIYVYFQKHISDEQLDKLCKELSLELVSKSSARATLRH